MAEVDPLDEQTVLSHVTSPRASRVREGGRDDDVATSVRGTATWQVSALRRVKVGMREGRR